jgi:serine/threonine protein kinase
MSIDSTSSAGADRNLLYGILAWQMDFISRNALILAMSAWARDRARPLGQILLEQQALSETEHDLLEAVVRQHLRRHNNDPSQSLAALQPIGFARQELEQITGPDLQSRLGLVAAAKLSAEETKERAQRSTPTDAGWSAGRFRIVRPHAKGGLGEVFIALDQELNREVVLKEIQNRHADQPESRARFVLEAEVTGGLEHPGIVPVYSLGSYSDGRPYYAMRFIQGDSLQQAINAYHQSERAGRDLGERSLALRSLLGRFIAVCNALSYAHSRGVLHRDLKPANIMLGKYGETLVVDWGLAKPLFRSETGASESTLQPLAVHDPQPTRTGAVLGTPVYMSPEQAAGGGDRLGPTSDVYSLGATLYHLLTGRPPFTSANMDDLILQVRNGNFPKPRQIQPRVPAALEAICLKAMARDLADRYATTQALANDVEHWLADESVQAHAEPWTTRAGRWLRRHRPLVTGAAAAAAVALVSLGLALVVVASKNQELANRAQSEQLAKEVAQQRLAQIDKGADILGSIFWDIDPHRTENQGMSLEEILGHRVNRAAAQLEGESIADTLIVAKLQSILGVSLLNLGHYSSAEALLDKAYATRTAQLGDDNPDTLIACSNLALAYGQEGKVDQAIPLLEHTLKVQEFKLGNDHPDTLMSCNNLAAAYQAAGKVDPAIALFERTVKAREASLGTRHPETLVAQSNLANAYVEAGKFDIAIPLFERTLRVEEITVGADHVHTLTCRNNLARAYKTIGRPDLAIPLLEQTAKSFEAKLGADHPNTLTARNNLARAFQAAGKLELAIPLFESTLKGLEAKLGDDHPNTLKTRNSMALAYQASGRLDMAVALFDKVVPQARKKLGLLHPWTREFADNRIAALEAGRHYLRAIQARQEWVLDQRQAFGNEDPRLAVALTQLGRTLLAAQQAVDAETVLRESMTIRMKKEPDAWTTFQAQALLGSALLDQHKDADAESLLLSSYEGMKRCQAKIPAADKAVLTETLERLVLLYEKTGKKDDALKWRKELEATKAPSAKR